jgi:site-specific recombinase XerD
MNTRKPNGRSSIFQDKNGLWHGYVTLAVKTDGSPDRRHRMGKTEAEVTAKVRQLEEHRDAGTVAKAGRAPTVATWLRLWLDTIAPRTASESTIESTYRPKVERWIIPRIGQHRIDRLRPEHLDALYLELAEDGLSSKSILMVHQIISRAYKMALRRGVVARNVATLDDSPRHRESEIEPLTKAEARRILAVSASTATAPAGRSRSPSDCGSPKPSACGGPIPISTRASFRVFQLKRSRYRHGCADPHSCIATRHRSSCRPECTLHAQYCPQRRGGEWTFQEPKGGRTRTVVIPRPLVQLLKAHRTAQRAERLAAGRLWQDWDLVFARPDGRPIDPADDWAEWKKLTKAAGVRDARVHDARHTAATLLLEQGVDIRVVQDILGHSTLAVTRRYTHVTNQLARDAAERMGRALWASS